MNHKLTNYNSTINEYVILRYVNNSNMIDNNSINIIKPYLPSFEKFSNEFKNVWISGQLSNNGIYCQKFEKRLAEYLQVPYVSLINNCTTGLLIALKALDISGEVITTPYSFIASSTPILWNNLVPVFVDIDRETFNIDISKIGDSISSNTSAILGVHAYGNSLYCAELNKVAKDNNLKLIYDGAAGFGSKYQGKSIFNYGDISVVSFHATKILHTFEGGAIICSDPFIKDKIDQIRNFGINENGVISHLGINAKLSEFNSLLGIHQLDEISEILRKRRKIAGFYNKSFSSNSNIKIPNFLFTDEYNYAYYPILIKEKSTITRDHLFDIFLSHNIYLKKYYYPLITDTKPFAMYKKYFPISSSITSNVLCLPIYPDLPKNDQQKIIEILNINT